MTALVTVEANTLLDSAVSTGCMVRLMTANGSATAAGTEVANSGGSTYAAKSSTWSAASGQSKVTSADIVFTGMPVCTVVGVEVWNSANTTRLAFGAVQQTKTFALNDTATISAGTGLSLNFT